MHWKFTFIIATVPVVGMPTLYRSCYNAYCALPVLLLFFRLGYFLDKGSILLLLLVPRSSCCRIGAIMRWKLKFIIATIRIVGMPTLYRSCYNKAYCAHPVLLLFFRLGYFLDKESIFLLLLVPRSSHCRIGTIMRWKLKFIATIRIVGMPTLYRSCNDYCAHPVLLLFFRLGYFLHRESIFPLLLVPRF